MRNILLIPIGIFFSNLLLAQQNNGKVDIAQKVNNAANKVTTIIAVFQPYLLKARQLFYDAKQLTGDVKNSAKNTFGKNGNNTGVAGGYTNNNNTNSYGYTDTSNNANYPNGNNNGNYNNGQGTNSNSVEQANIN